MSTATGFEPQPTPGVIPPPGAISSSDAFQPPVQPGIEPTPGADAIPPTPTQQGIDHSPIFSTTPADGENGIPSPEPPLATPTVEATTIPPATQSRPNFDALLQPDPESKTQITDLAVRADELMKSLTDPELKEAVVRTFERGAAQMLGVSTAPVEPENKPQ